ncbi:hypothetical protein Fmac_024959 [Flemingia macrophylla]|uniref:Uncharacterized protein n=1 Tax=Flemingia macrophylla TaxID=520843 RepID=A0ABD1LQW0_9FABA
MHDRTKLPWIVCRLALKTGRIVVKAGRQLKKSSTGGLPTREIRVKSVGSYLGRIPETDLKSMPLSGGVPSDVHHKNRLMPPVNIEVEAKHDYFASSLDNNALCALCTTKLSTLLSYLTCPTVGNVSDCRAYTASYAASLSDQYGPTSPDTAKCLFGLDFSSHSSAERSRYGVCGSGNYRDTGILLLAEVITHIESKPVDSAIVHCLVGFFKDELLLFHFS